MGYVPQILPQSYIESRSFSGLGETFSPPPLVQANASNNATGAGGFLSIFSSIFGGAGSGAGGGAQTFYALSQQMDAERIAEERSRRWAAFGAVAVGIAGLAGVVYLLRK